MLDIELEFDISLSFTMLESILPHEDMTEFEESPEIVREALNNHIQNMPYDTLVDIYECTGVREA